MPQRIGTRRARRSRTAPGASRVAAAGSWTEHNGRAAASLLRHIPSLDGLLARPRLAELSSRLERRWLVETAREVLAELRAELAGAGVAPSQLECQLAPEQIEARIVAAAKRLLTPSLRAVINATGVVLHTNLGRAPLALEAIEHLREVVTRYSNLEYDLDTGKRGARDVHTGPWLARLCGAEAAVVVNNNAAAVYLVLAALARGGEVIVSRGELIEIGDGFRIPDIMAESGAALREVGTTNRTRLADYQRAMNQRTRLILRVHRSNFRLVGFAAEPSLAELAALGRRASIPVYEDLGSGCLEDLRAWRVEEPVVRESFAAGVRLVSFSGDKLLGGPQAGIIAGDRALVARIRRHPMFRALRVDKLTIAALEGTLLARLRRAAVTDGGIPALRMISTDAARLAERSRRLLEALTAQIAADGARFEIRKSQSLVGGGSTPGQSLPSQAIAIAPKRISPEQLEERLRRPPHGMPVIARLGRSVLWLDLRTVFPDQEPALLEAVAAALEP
jgi:L-seryl-tRNA(Ser) seleniumtransferase